MIFQQLDTLAPENCVFQQSLFCSFFDSWRLVVEHDEVEIQLILFQREGKKHLLIASASTKLISLVSKATRNSLISITESNWGEY